MPAGSPPPVSPELDATSESRFVGRRRELQVLEDAWESVQRGFRQVLFIGGEPGIGKSRLAAQAAKVLSREGAVVLVGTTSSEFPIPYQPLVEVLDDLVGKTDAGVLPEALLESAGQLARLTSRMARHRPNVPLDSDRDREHRRELFDAYVEVLIAASTDCPIVLILEDLHRARMPTLQLLNHIVSSTAETRLLVLATLRTTQPDLSSDLTGAVAEMYRLPGVQQIDLDGLETEYIVDLLFRGVDVSSDKAESSAAALRSHTGGNPFFLKELWKALSSSGGIDVLGRDFRAPRSIRDALGIRIAGLDSSHLAIIQIAALIGESFNLTTLTSASAPSRTETLDAIDRAIEFELIVPEHEDPGRYRFAHELARQSILDRISITERAKAHATIAEALEARAHDSPEIVARLAHHYSAAAPLGYEAEAAKYLRRAAEFASRSLAYEDAADGYERAAALAREGHDELLLLAARCRVEAGDFEAARDTYGRLSTSGDPATRLEAAIGYENASWRPGRTGHEAVGLLSDALEVYSSAEPDALFIDGLASLGRALTFTGADQDARVMGEKAIELAEQNGDALLIARSLQASLWRSWDPGTASQQLDRAILVSQIGATERDYGLLGQGAYFRAAISYTQGRRWDVVAAHADLRRVATTTGQPFYAYMVGCLDASEEFRRGDFVACRAAVEQLASVGEVFGQDDTGGSYGLQVFMIQRATAGLETVRQLVTGDESWSGHWLPGLLALYTELGLEEAARGVLHEILTEGLEVGYHSVQWPAIVAFLVDAIVMLGDAVAARRIHPVLDRYRGCNLVAGQFVAVFGSADRYLARLEAMLNDPAADESFRSALDMDTSMGSVIHQAETLAAYAQYLAQKPDRSSRDRAAEYRTEAVRLAKATGYKRVLRSLDALLDLPANLSYREVDVIRLLAEGCSNKEIGERLHISQNTAANHVRSILMKTGSPNRTRAAVFASQHNLLE